tara:strand:+ start:2112 stop:2237 length:126 start_codon:yes stop_codon:yes gene_type:complete
MRKAFYTRANIFIHNHKVRKHISKAINKTYDWVDGQTTEKN